MLQTRGGGGVGKGGICRTSRPQYTTITIDESISKNKINYDYDCDYYYDYYDDDDYYYYVMTAN